MANQQNFVSKETLEKLNEEVKYLKEIKRLEIASLLRDAIAQGDLSENAEYSSAKEAQAITESKIAELEHKIKNAVIITGKGGGSNVTIGSTVKINNKDEELEYTIVGSRESNPSEGKISNESPMGVLLLGKKVGDCVKMHYGDEVCEYEVVEIK